MYMGAGKEARKYQTPVLSRICKRKGGGGEKKREKKRRKLATY
jgi:hypothetical protein